MFDDVEAIIGIYSYFLARYTIVQFKSIFNKQNCHNGSICYNLILNSLVQHNTVYVFFFEFVSNLVRGYNVLKLMKCSKRQEWSDSYYSHWKLSIYKEIKS